MFLRHHQILNQRNAPILVYCADFFIKHINKKYNIFDKKAVFMKELPDALKNSFEGNERIRELLHNCRSAH